MTRFAVWFRVAAIAIAIAGAIDPAIATRARIKPDVAVVSAGPLPDPALVDRVTRALSPIATIVRGPSIGASAVVSIGYELPDVGAIDAPAAFAVLPIARTPFITIESIRSPARGDLEARVPVIATVHTRAAKGHVVTAQLELNGVVIDEVKRTPGGDDETITVELGLVSPRPGPLVATVMAQVDGSKQPAQADLSMRISPDRHAVLFFDRRPSWLSSFVRRSLESDPRFVVSSRTSTSRGADIKSGTPPPALSAASLNGFELVVIGAPDLLTNDDAAGIESYLRSSGGAVCLLMDASADNAVIDRLTGVTRWTSANRAEPSGIPLAAESRRPIELPKWATPLSPTGAAVNGETTVWQTAVGSGRLIVSGALDAWRYRERDHGAFDRFWRLVAADATAGPAPEAETSAPLRQPTPDEQDLLRAWTESHGGTLIDEDKLDALVRAIEQKLNAPDETVVAHPMRSAWWIVPFAGCLGFEWWTRRRSGMR